VTSAHVQTTSFDELQRKLVPLWKSIQYLNQDEQTIVVVPSLTLDTAEESGSELQAYEERFLFLLLLLRQARARMVYVTSQRIDPAIIDYYLGLLPGVIPSHARKRLFLPSPLDGSPRPLSAKLLERPRLIEQIRGLVTDPDRAHLVPYNTTELERDLAVALGIPMYGADPRFFPLGTKSGCRRLFVEEDVPHPLGFEDLGTVDDVVEALGRMRAARPDVAQAMVKLNEGVSGEGNALVDLEGLPPPGDPAEREAIRERVRGMSFELPSVRFDWYAAKLEERGGIVEERIIGTEVRSPSVQLRVTPLGEVELLSTHDQILGGPSGQSYIGARFPADTGYAAEITREAAKIGARLAREGVIGRFALDFVVVRDDGGPWRPYAIELNLRKGGTTHPFLTLQFLTDGTYDPEAAEFTAPSGRRKCFVASDKVQSEAFRGLTPEDLFDVAVRHGLHFDQSRQTGVVFHMMSAMPEHGRLGLTAIGESHGQADELYEGTVSVLEDEAKASWG
jgi:pheganomycin biosynthesis PGM1-like protein